MCTASTVQYIHMLTNIPTAGFPASAVSGTCCIRSVERMHSHVLTMQTIQHKLQQQSSKFSALEAPHFNNFINNLKDKSASFHETTQILLLSEKGRTHRRRPHAKTDVTTDGKNGDVVFHRMHKQGHAGVVFSLTASPSNTLHTAPINSLNDPVSWPIFR